MYEQFRILTETNYIITYNDNNKSQADKHFSIFLFIQYLLSRDEREK